ncbi:MAG: hypothetical protein HN856_03690 [Gammaproteobacteria bacterium]|jgi:hypothetical protein|nr:hypothetical protein [Gammaproteobacteria bacterium]MCH1551614.1 hypothetical protein [Pseudomonadales bacterium]
MIFETSIGHTGHPLYRYRDGPNSAYIMRLENGALLPAAVVAGSGYSTAQVLVAANHYIRTTLLMEVA